MGAPSPATKPARRRAPAKKATAAKRPAVVLDLDSLSKQEAFPNDDIPDVDFSFLLAGHDYVLRDPRDTDWKLALNLSGNPFLLMRIALVGADDQVDNPTDDEIAAARERRGLPQQPPPPGSEEAAEEAALWPDGVPVCLIDRFTAAGLPAWKLNALFSRWHEHYRIDISSARSLMSALLGRSE